MPASHTDLANAIRFLAIDAVEAAKSGHPGMPMGMADVATVLFTRFLKFNPAQPDWPDRDRFVLSAGHGSMLLYALAHLTGYARMTKEELMRFRQLGALTAGHPEHDVGVGIETTTGPLGQGLATAVGMALGERILNAEFGDELVDHHTYVIASDGDMMEGISHEAASLAGHLKLSRLIVLYDDNKICIDGPTSLSFSDNTEQRFEAYGWHTLSIDGHDPEAIAEAIEAAHTSDRPTLICCRTTIGYGSPNKQGTSATHGSPLGTDETKATREKLGWTHEPFTVPPEIMASWRNAGARHTERCLDWTARLARHDKAAEFTRRMKGELPANLPYVFSKLKEETLAAKAKIASRQSSGNVLAALVPALPELLGGSADLTPSNNTKTKDSVAVSAGNYGGRYLHWGIREHGMAAAMNGLALHGGFIPYSGTFLCFADYCRPAIRLSALMQQRVVYVMTHDSIGLGEDGPTHQPVEHLAALRAIPNLLVMRPCDTIETAECWEAALAHANAPTVMVLSRQNLPLLRDDASENQSAKGGYVLAESAGPRQVTLMATGSEVMLAMEAKAELEKGGINAAVVSLPCFALFEQQPLAYRHQVLGHAPRVAVEAAVSQGWNYYLGDNGAFIGMNSFGASAPAEALYKHFGITVEAVVQAAKGLL